MSLLSDDDKALLVLEHLGPAALAGDTMSLYDCFQLALDVAEKAVLEKLASAELPEPQQYPAECFMQSLQVCDAVAVSIAIQKSHAQGFAAGAAAQLAELPKCWAIFTEDGNARMWSTFQPHVQKLADAEGLAVTELYTRREA